MCKIFYGILLLYFRLAYGNPGMIVLVHCTPTVLYSGCSSTGVLTGVYSFVCMCFLYINMYIYFALLLVRSAPLEVRHENVERAGVCVTST